MAKARPFQDPVHCCIGKRRYPTKKDAATKAARLRRLYGEKIDYYKCQYCRFYHAGHPPGAKYQKEVDE